MRICSHYHHENDTSLGQDTCSACGRDLSRLPDLTPSDPSNHSPEIQNPAPRHDGWVPVAKGEAGRDMLIGGGFCLTGTLFTVMPYNLSVSTGSAELLGCHGRNLLRRIPIPRRTFQGISEITYHAQTVSGKNGRPDPPGACRLIFSPIRSEPQPSGSGLVSRSYAILLTPVKDSHLV